MRFAVHDRCALVVPVPHLILGLDHRTVRDLFSNFRAWLTPIVDRLNEEFVVGSAGADIELDEISFRSKPLEDKVAWAL